MHLGISTYPFLHSTRVLNCWFRELQQTQNLYLSIQVLKDKDLPSYSQFTLTLTQTKLTHCKLKNTKPSPTSSPRLLALPWAPAGPVLIHSSCSLELAFSQMMCCFKSALTEITECSRWHLFFWLMFLLQRKNTRCQTSKHFSLTC